MTASEDNVKKALDSLVQRYTSGSMNPIEKPMVGLTSMLHGQFPGDVGVLCVFMLNVVDLKEGEAAYLQANEPHAYISGGQSSPIPRCPDLPLSRYHRVHGDER